uniref:FBD domain-containing protein n=1 Tax=Oryza punctata TaxID=4537 RepID=A0A0E0M7M9_ORYPU
MAAGGGDDRLSDLPDDLLLRILCLEAASIGALSRRWGSLWWSSGAVNLAASVYFDGAVSRSVSLDEREEAFSSCRDAFKEARWNSGVYSLIVAFLPTETLRVLDIAGCTRLALPSAAAAAFPRLETLQLRRCVVRLKTPTTRVGGRRVVRRRRHRRSDGESGSDTAEEAPHPPPLPGGHHSRAGTVTYDDDNNGGGGGIAIDAPKLCSFTYTRVARRFYLKSPVEAADMEEVVHLHFLHDYHLNEDATRVHFWRFVGNFTNAKALKLKLHNRPPRRRQGEPSRAHPHFPQPRAPQARNGGAAAGDRQPTPLLPPSLQPQARHVTSILEFQQDFDNSIAKVSLKFQIDSPDNFGARLVRFLAQNAKVLEEMYIDSGDRKLCEHINLIESWVGADGSSINISSKQKNFVDSSSFVFSRTYPGMRATSLTVLPLERWKSSMDD